MKSPVKHRPVIGMLGSGPPLQLTVAAGFTVKTDETAVADEAVIVTPVAVATLPEETENVALVLPAGIVTEDGTDTTAEVPLESDMTMPPVGAGPTATTVPVEPFPLTTEFGAKARDDSSIVAVPPPTLPLPPQPESPKPKVMTTATDDNLLARNHRMSHLNGAVGPFKKTRNLGKPQPEASAHWWSRTMPPGW